MKTHVLQTWPAISHNCSLMLLGLRGGGGAEKGGRWMCEGREEEDRDATKGCNSLVLTTWNFVTDIGQAG